MTYIQKLQDLLCELEKELCSFISNIKIKEFRNDPYSGVVIITHPYFYLTDIGSDLKKQQIDIKKKYLEWEEHFNLLTFKLPDDIKKEINDSTSFIMNQVELKSDWLTEGTTDENIVNIKKRFNCLFEILKLFERDQTTVFIPDTNTLIFSPDFEIYKTLLGENITILLSPTVLSELDELKIKHRDENFRDKVNGVINRIKGYRIQGSLLQGVTSYKTITIKMVANEPNFQKTLSWLDKENKDDRIIATAIEYQINNPSNSVYIISSDINLQNKAEMAKFPYFETPLKK